MKRLWIALFILAVTACGLPVDEDEAPIGQSRAAMGAVTATVGPGDNTLTVSWPDETNETGYRVYATQSTNPNGVLDADSVWRLQATVGPNVTTFRHSTPNPNRYIVCAEFDSQGGTVDPLQCSAASARVTPTGSKDIAEIRNLETFNIGTRLIGVTWTESISTERSRVSISPAGTGQSSVINAPDETFVFTGLQPGRTHVITGCVASSDQLALGEETCQSISVSTWEEVDAPTGLRSLSVNVADPSPHSRTITFRHESSNSSPVSSFSVRLFDDGASSFREEKRVVSRGTGSQEYSVTFTGLEPFASFEAWVIPLNVSGPGPSKGIGFTTPIELVADTEPLSSNSAMLLFEATAVGDYTVEVEGVPDVRLATVQVLNPGPQRMVLDQLTASKTVRVKWSFAGLKTVSNDVVATRGPSGAPEVRTGFLGPQFQFGSPLPLRVSATFTPTVTSLNGKYVLQAMLFGGGTRSLAIDEGAFISGTRYTLSDLEQLIISTARVCRESTSKLGVTLSCSATLPFSTDGLLRLH